MYLSGASPPGPLFWLAEPAQASKTLVMTPHVMEQPYLALHRAGLEVAGRAIVQSYYLPHSELMHTRESLTKELQQKLAGADLLATSRSLRELGLRDGLTREIVEPTDGGDGTYQWDDVRLRRVRKFGSTIVWEVVRQ